MGAQENGIPSLTVYLIGMDRDEPFDIIAALQSQVEANAERLRRTRKMVAIMSEHLEALPADAPKKRRAAK